MRKALGLLGEAQRHRPDVERLDHSPRPGDRFGGAPHRRRFVQDGDIPVTVLRREAGAETPAHRGAAATPPPTSSRLQRTEAALATETAAREKAERLLADTQGVVRDLQTKIGHAELTKNEAIEALRREREAIAQLRADTEAQQQRLQEAQEQSRVAERLAHVSQEQLADERHARKTVEKALRCAEAARDTAEQLVRTLSNEVPPVQRMPEPKVSVIIGQRGRATATEEPEPVKWWLNTRPAGKKR